MICLVTDRHRLVTSSRSDSATAADEAQDRLLEIVEAAAAAGVDLVQIRERDMEARQLVALAQRCLTCTKGTRTHIVINDRVDVAVAAGAHGVHLRANSIDPLDARSLLPPSGLIGRSVHSREEIERLTQSGSLDYFIFGTMFASASKDRGHRLASVDELSAVCRGAGRTPVLAIGGMTIERAADVVRAGASGIAGIGLFIPRRGSSARAHLESVVGSLRRVFDTCRAVP